MLSVDKTFGPCCNIKNMPSKIFPKNKSEIMELWNSQKFVDVRRRVLEGKTDGTSCESCYDRFFSEDYGIFGMGQMLPVRSLNKSNGYREFYGRANAAYAAGSLVLDYTPPEIYIFTSRNCNLRCKMCPFTSANAHQKYAKVVYPVENIISLLKEIGWNKIDRIGLIGGEPLMTPDALTLLRFLAGEKLNGTCVYITTNGMLIDNQIDLLKKLENLQITVSVDGTNETYEKIRTGATWIRLVNNMNLLKNVKKRERPNWKITINSIVMKSTIPYLLSLLKFGAEMGASVFFSSIVGTTDEDIFLDPHLLRVVPDWENYIDSTLDYAKQIGDNKAYDSLSVVKRRIKLAFEMEKSNPLASRIARANNKLRMLLGYYRNTLLP